MMRAANIKVINPSLTAGIHIILILQLSVCLCVTYEREVTGSYATSEKKVAFLFDAALRCYRNSSLSLIAMAVANTEVSCSKRAARQN